MGMFLLAVLEYRFSEGVTETGGMGKFITNLTQMLHGTGFGPNVGKYFSPMEHLGIIFRFYENFRS